MVSSSSDVYPVMPPLFALDDEAKCINSTEYTCNCTKDKSCLIVCTNEVRDSSQVRSMYYAVNWP